MKILVAILLTVTVLSTAYAGSSVTKNWAMPSPPTASDPGSLYDFLLFLYTHFNQVQIVTIAPNGTRRGQAGNVLLYNNSGTWQVCFETAQPNGTTWKCANLT